MRSYAIGLVLTSLVGCGGSRRAPAPPARPAAEGAQASYARAVQRQNAGDGRACLQALDEHDRGVSPALASTTPGAPAATVRARCLMVAGRCPEGRALFRAAVIQTSSPPPERVDDIVEGEAGRLCRGSGMTERERVSAAMNALMLTAKAPPECDDATAVVRQLGPRVPPRDKKDEPIYSAHHRPDALIAGCYARTGACDTARTVWLHHRRSTNAQQPPHLRRSDAELQQEVADQYRDCGR